MFVSSPRNLNSANPVKFQGACLLYTAKMVDRRKFSVGLLFALLRILSINGEPAPTVVALTTSSVILEFNTENWPASTYHVEYSEIPVSRYTKGAQVTADPDTTVDRITQPGLIPARRYQMRIVPMIDARRGVPSDSVQVTIPQPTISAAPVVVFRTTSSATVEFQAANGSARSYEIEFSRNPVTSYTPSGRTGARPGVKVYRLSAEPLRSGSSYQIRVVPLVLVGNSNHKGIPSPSVTVIIPRPVIIDPPRINFISPSSISAQFFQSNGASTHYLIQYKLGAYDEAVYTDGARVKDEARGVGIPYTALQDGLSPDTGYTLRIMPIVSFYGYDHNGAASPTVRFTTPGRDFTPGPATFVPNVPCRTTVVPSEPCDTMFADVPSSHGAVVTAVVGVGCFVGGCLISGLLFVTWRMCKTEKRAKYEEPDAPSTPHTYEELHQGRGPKRKRQAINEQSLPPIPTSQAQRRQNTNNRNEDTSSAYVEVLG